MPSSRTGTPHRAAKLTEVDARRVAEQDQRQRRLGQVRTAEPVLERSIPSSAFGPTNSPKPTNSIAGVIGVPTNRPRDGGNAKERKRHQDQGPLHRDIMAVPAAPRDGGKHGRLICRSPTWPRPAESRLLDG